MLPFELLAVLASSQNDEPQLADIVRLTHPPSPPIPNQSQERREAPRERGRAELRGGVDGESPEVAWGGGWLRVEWGAG